MSRVAASMNTVDTTPVLRRAVTYRMYPTAGQTVALNRLLESQRVLYNAALEERVGAWKWNRHTVTRFDQYKQLTGATETVPSLNVYGLAPHRGTEYGSETETET